MPLVIDKLSALHLGTCISTTPHMCLFQVAPGLEKLEEDESLIPMFLTELILTVESLLFEPSLEDFLVCVYIDHII